jgi:hypothetical protein
LLAGFQLLDARQAGHAPRVGRKRAGVDPIADPLGQLALWIGAQMRAR